MSVAPIEDRRLAGILLIILAVLMFTGIDSCAKWLVLAGMDPIQVVFVRYAAHVMLVSALFLPRLGLRLFSTGKPWIELARAIFLLGATVCNFIAVQYLPLTLTATIFFTAPLWICALSTPFLGERVGPRRWAAILIGFGGVLVATRPWGAEVHWAASLSMGAAVCAACYALLTRRLAGVDATATQNFYSAALATIGAAPLALADWSWPSAAPDWVAFALIGVFGWGGHQVLVIAHRYAPASALAPFVYIQIVFMTSASWLIFATPPDPWVLAGAAVVLASGLYIWLRERRLAAAPTADPTSRSRAGAAAARHPPRRT